MPQGSKDRPPPEKKGTFFKAAEGKPKEGNVCKAGTSMCLLLF